VTTEKLERPFPPEDAFKDGSHDPADNDGRASSDGSL
jgi:hypothetical protein